MSNFFFFKKTYFYKNNLFLLNTKINLIDILKKKNIKHHNGLYFFKRRNYSIVQLNKNVKNFIRFKGLKSHPFKNIKF